MSRRKARTPDEPDQLEAPESAVAVDDARWLNGVNRQLRDDAVAQRSAASKAAAAKRTAGAMSPAARVAKRQADQRRRREAATIEREQRSHAEAEAAAAEPDWPADDAPEDEWLAFYRKRLELENGEEPTEERVYYEYIDHVGLGGAPMPPPLPPQPAETIWYVLPQGKPPHSNVVCSTLRARMC